MLSTESKRINSIAENSLYAAGANTDMIQYSFQIFKRHLAGKTILELGPAEGVMTELLNKSGLALTLVEGSSLFCRSLEKRFPKAKVYNSLFEEFLPEQQFDNIIMGHVLEHVEDPISLLIRAQKSLSPNGKILSAVPNAHSIHRQAAVLMGLLKSENSLSEADIHHGHRRVFTPDSFKDCFVKAGLKIEVMGGYWLKPLSNKQIEENWTPAMLNAFMALGEKYPDIAGEIYVISTKSNEL